MTVHRMPIECHHGKIRDWGDFGPANGKPPIIEDCDRCDELETQRDAYVWVSPARKCGEPCIGGTRIPVDMVADFVWSGDYDELVSAHGYNLTPHQVKVGCWYWWTRGAALPKRDPRREWAEAAAIELWHTTDPSRIAAVPEPPAKPSVSPPASPTTEQPE